MKGVTHATSGLAAGAIISTAMNLTPNIALPTMLITAGAAMLPDFDHPQASPARMYGKATETLAIGISKLAGGHRKGTHTFYFPLLMGVLVFAAIVWVPANVGTYIVSFLLMSLAFTGLQMIPAQYRWAFPVICGGVTWWLVSSGFVGVKASLFVSCLVAVGAYTHLLGDMLTESGVPLLGPIPVFGKPWRRISFIPGFLQHRGWFVSSGWWDMTFRVACMVIIGVCALFYAGIIVL